MAETTKLKASEASEAPEEPVAVGNPEAPEENGGEEAKVPTIADILDRLQPDPEHEPTYDLRDFKTKDTMRLIGMIRKARGNEGIRRGAVAAQMGDTTAAGIGIFGGLLDEMEDEIVPFLADLANMNMEEFGEEPGGAVFDIMADAINDDGFLAAFRSALRFVEAGRRLFGRS